MAEVIVALDQPSGDDALALAGRLPGLRWAKVGATLYTAAGPDVVRALVARGVRVFLDLKWHDIPHQVAGAVAAAADLGVELVTVHALGGRVMLEAAARAGGARVRVAGVSVLTSHDGAGLAEVLGRPVADVGDEVRRLAGLVRDAGCGAMVASAHEAGVVAGVLGAGRWVVVPGIRPAGAAAGDQRRIATPAAAVGAGATHLVVGRPITGADDPARVYQALCEEAQ